jgi:molecular chaperone DnaK (HSP70)
MADSLGVQHAVEEIISSYEQRLRGIGFIIDNTQMILGEFQESLSDTKQEREELKIELRDTLARNESLRKKDFDAMMNTILSSQDDREREVRGLLSSYLTEQRDMAKTLRENLGSFRDSLNRDNIDRVQNFHQMLQDILNKQEERKTEVTEKLTTYQKEQSELSSTLAALLSRGRDLRTRDLKLMLKHFETRSRERAIQHWERNQDVQMMLNSYRKTRLERAHV